MNVEDNENDKDSSFSDPELCPIEDIDEDEFAIPQEFFPLASQCSPSPSQSDQLYKMGSINHYLHTGRPASKGQDQHHHM